MTEKLEQADKWFPETGMEKWPVIDGDRIAVTTIQSVHSGDDTVFSDKIT